MLNLKYAIFKSPEWYKEYLELKRQTDNEEKNLTENKKDSSNNNSTGITVRNIINTYRPYHPITPAEAVSINDKKNNLDLLHARAFMQMKDYAFYSVEEIPSEFMLDRIPESGRVFVSCNYKPNYYYPLEIFREKLDEIKIDAICDMMKDLGAKTILYGRNISIRKMRGLSISLGTFNNGIKDSNTNEEGGTILKEYLRPNEIKKSTNPFILDHPFWSKHQTERIEDKVPKLKYTWTIEKETMVDLNHSGIFQEIKYKVGGNSSAHKKDTVSFIVEYWDM